MKRYNCTMLGDASAGCSYAGMEVSQNGEYYKVSDLQPFIQRLRDIAEDPHFGDMKTRAKLIKVVKEML